VETKEKIMCPHCGGELNIGALMGSRTSDKKATSSAENGKKGGRPKKVILDKFSVNAMKEGNMYILMLVPLHVLGRGEKARYRLVVCHPGGGQTDAEHQPINDGSMPDIQLLAEENGFEVLDIFDFMPRNPKQ